MLAITRGGWVVGILFGGFCAFLLALYLADADIHPAERVARIISDLAERSRQRQR